jgi:glycosyltransferase involved in cell wall biosynthesis
MQSRELMGQHNLRSGSVTVSEATARKQHAVSVVIPYSPKHTPEELLETTIKSVEEQTVSTEIIVVTDHEQQGPGWARNEGLDQAKYRFVAFLDADDLWDPRKLERQIQRIQRTEAGICVQGESIPSEEFVYRLVLDEVGPEHEVHPVTSSVLIDRDEVDVRFDTELKHKEDHLFIIEAISQSSVCFCPDIVKVRRHGESLTSQSEYQDLHLEYRLKFMEKVQNVVDLPEDVIMQYYHDLYYAQGRLSYFDGEYRGSVSCLVKSLKHGVKPKAVAALAQSLLLVAVESVKP